MILFIKLIVLVNLIIEYPDSELKASPGISSENIDSDKRDEIEMKSYGEQSGLISIANYNEKEIQNFENQKELDYEISKLETEIAESSTLYNEKLKEIENLKNSPEEAKNVKNELAMLALMIEESKKKLNELKQFNNH